MGIQYGNSNATLLVGKDTVYVHTDIQKVEIDAEGNPIDNLWQYHEIQYGKDEFIKLISTDGVGVNADGIDSLAEVTDVSASAIDDLAGYVASLEERIAELELKLEESEE
jgi:hypothetical protein